MGDVATLMSALSDWNRELSSRRDPSAHRIPLSIPPAVLDAESSIPPAVLDAESREEYTRVSAEYSEAFNAAVASVSKTGDLEMFEKADLLNNQLQKIGRFMPVFVHHPDEGAIRIYPTVPQDIAQVVKIARGISNIISTKVGGGI